MVHIYTLTKLRNSTIPTLTQTDRVGKLRLVRRNFSLDQGRIANSPWLSCSCLLGSSHLVNIVTVLWQGGLLDVISNQTELKRVYTQETERNESASMVTIRLRLNVPVMDSRAFGEYRCVFSFHGSENVIGHVYLFVPPILRLVYDPPPIPPTNFTNQFTCNEPPCSSIQPDDDASIPLDAQSAAVANWTGACHLVAAYPPLLPRSFVWGWTNAKWASYALERVADVGKETYLSELAAEHSDDEDEEGTASPFSPLQVLERRRRHAVTEASVTTGHLEVESTRPTEPIIFWCVAKSTLAETAIWWPGPSKSDRSVFWVTIWWPIFGVSLELASLALVFGCFRYFNHKRQMQAYGVDGSPHHANASFNLSRLIDSRTSTSSSVGTGVDGKRVTPLTGTLQAAARFVPYTRLAHSSSSTVGEANNTKIGAEDVVIRGHDNPAALTSYPDDFGDEDPIEPDHHEVGSRPGGDTPGADEYFWDSDNEPRHSDIDV